LYSTDQQGKWQETPRGRRGYFLGPAAALAEKLDDPDEDDGADQGDDKASDVKAGALHTGSCVHSLPTRALLLPLEYKNRYPPLKE
jgi:hypothetical protein